jgi:CheY-like chemotaxis protein
MALRILHVEDNDGDAQLLREALTNLRPDLDVRGAASVDAAQQAIDASDQPFDLIILDLNLPRCGGLDLLRRLRADRGSPCPRIVILTGMEVPAERRQSTQADAYFLKPTDWEQWEVLSARLLRAMTLPREQRPNGHRTPFPRAATPAPGVRRSPLI